MSGLRELWNLGDRSSPYPQASPAGGESDKRAFLDAMRRLNISLQFTAVHAPAESHLKLVQRRDELFIKYQQATSPKKPNQDAFREVLAQTVALGGAAEKYVDGINIHKERWEQQAKQLEMAEDAIAQLPSEDPQGASLRQGLDRVNQAAKSRNYQKACQELQAIPTRPEVSQSATPGSHTSASSSRKAKVSEVPPKATPVINEQRYPLQGNLESPPEVPQDLEAFKRWENPLIHGDPHTVFQSQNMDEVAQMHFQGEATAENPALNQAMKAILFAEPGEDVSKQLAELGRLRGLDEETLQQQMARFQQFRSVASQVESVRGLPPDEVLNSRSEEYLETHGDFLGTRSSLRFGQVVGEATGLDPAFAAMLNPTGGMVGSGMDVLAPTDANSPVVLHGIFHDAGGYLLNYQNAGPGYTYLEDQPPESGRKGSHPVQGQVEGVSYWYERMEPNRSILEDLYEPDLTAQGPENKQLAYDRFVKHPIEDAQAIANNLTQETVSNLGALTQDVREKNQQAVQDLKNTAHTTGDRVQEQVQRAKGALKDMASVARELGVDDQMVDSAEESIGEDLETLHEQIESWEQDAAQKFDAVGEMVEQQLQDLERWTEEAGVAVQQKTDALAEGVEQNVHQSLLEVAQNKDLQETLRHGANFVGETHQDAKELLASLENQIDVAKEHVNQFNQQAAESIVQANQQAAEQLAVVKGDLIGKLDSIQDRATEAVGKLQQQTETVASNLGKARQDILDIASGVTDSLDDVVSSGTDMLVNVMGSCSELAAQRLDSLTNLLG